MSSFSEHSGHADRPSRHGRHEDANRQARPVSLIFKRELLKRVPRVGRAESKPHSVKAVSTGPTLMRSAVQSTRQGSRLVFWTITEKCHVIDIDPHVPDFFKQAATHFIELGVRKGANIGRILCGAHLASPCLWERNSLGHQRRGQFGAQLFPAL